MPNTTRQRVTSANGHGPDAANTFFVSVIMRNSFLDEVRTNVTGAGVVIKHALLENDSASVVLMGIGARLANAKWIAGQWTAATSAFADDSTDAKSAAASDFALQTTTDNDGHIIACLEKFSAVLYDVGTAAVDAAGAGGVTGEWTYWNGSAWSALTTLAVSGTSRFYVAGRNEVLFAAPTDWATATSTEITGLNAGSWYAVRYRAAGAGGAPDTTAALATTIQVWDPLRIVRGQIAANTTEIFVDASDEGVLVAGAGEGLVVCTTTADAGNFLSMACEWMGEAGVLGGPLGATASSTP